MKKVLSTAFLTLVSFLVMAPVALAADGAADNEFTFKSAIAIAAGLAIAIAAFAPLVWTAVQAAAKPARVAARIAASAASDASDDGSAGG